jgi:hypothetical protein
VGRGIRWFSGASCGASCGSRARSRREPASIAGVEGRRFKAGGGGCQCRRREEEGGGDQHRGVVAGVLEEAGIEGKGGKELGRSSCAFGERGAASGVGEGEMRCGRRDPCRSRAQSGDAGGISGRLEPCRVEKLDFSFSLGQGREAFLVRGGQCPAGKTDLPNTQIARNFS